MGISVISSPAAASASSAPSAMAPATNAAPTGFAAVLTGQLASSLGINGSVNATSSEELEKLPAASDVPPGLIDPALAMLSAPVITSRQITFDPASSDGIEAAGDGLTRSSGNSPLTMDISGASAERSAAMQAQAISQQLENAIAALKGERGQDGAAIIAAETPASAASLQQQSQLASQASHGSASSQAQPAAPNEGEVRTPLGASGWTQDFGEKIVWLAKNDQQTAQININPPQLGPVQITLQLNGDQASVVFGSAHAEVRQAIESSLSQLKEMFASAGINLSQTDIGANLAQQNRDTPFQTANGNRSAGENAILAGIGNIADSAVSTPVQRGRGLVDLFA